MGIKGIKQAPVTNVQIYKQCMANTMMVKALGMHAENMQRISNEGAIAYDEEAFYNLVAEHRMESDQIIEDLKP